MVRDPLQPRWLLRLRQRAVCRWAGAITDYSVPHEKIASGDVIAGVERLQQRIRANPLNEIDRERMFREVNGAVPRQRNTFDFTKPSDRTET